MLIPTIIYLAAFSFYIVIKIRDDKRNQQIIKDLISENLNITRLYVNKTKEVQMLKHKLKVGEE